MTTTNSVTNTTSTGTSATTATKTAAQETQDRFLKMLVAQMQNQDPLNPMDNAQVTSQMAQLSTVTGINTLNDTVKAMSDSFLAGQSLQAASLVGHGVMFPGSKLTLSSGAAYGGVDLAGAVDKLVITVKDAAGNVVHTADLGAQKSGTVPFQWDGSTDAGTTAADGTYTFEVAATLAGTKVDATALSVGQVSSVSLGTSGASLNVAGFDPIALSQVKQIL